MRNETDEIIKRALINGTKTAVECKDSVWSNIDNALEYRTNMGIRCSRKLNKKKSKIGTFVKAAAVILAVFLAFRTAPGVQAINKVKSLLAPNKNVVHRIEGKEYEHQVSLVESKKGYTMYVDENVFKVEHLSDRDRITPKDKSANVPEVYMDIQQMSNTKPEDLYSKLQKDLKASGGEIYDNGKVTKPLNALSIGASSGTKWNDKLEMYYIVDDKKGGSFLITEHLFVEAAEGFGGRFDNCLMEFRLEE